MTMITVSKRTSRSRPAGHRTLSTSPVAAGLDWDGLCDGRLTVSVSGELCAWSVPMLEVAIRELIASEAPTSIVFDLSGVTFFGAHGVSMLRRCHRWASHAGVQASLGEVSAAVGKVADIVGDVACAPSSC